MNKMKAVTYASTQATLIATIVTQPLWVLKVRMLLNTDPNVTEFQNTKNKIKQIYTQDGFHGFMKGLSVSILLSFNGALQMYLYQGSKLLYNWADIPQTSLNEKNFICGVISKIVSIIFTYPLTTIRTRIQQNQLFNERQQAKYKNIGSIILKCFKNEGIQGFYKGIMVNLAKGVPKKGLYFTFTSFSKTSYLKIIKQKSDFYTNRKFNQFISIHLIYLEIAILIKCDYLRYGITNKILFKVKIIQCKYIIPMKKIALSY